MKVADLREILVDLNDDVDVLFLRYNHNNSDGPSYENITYVTPMELWYSPIAQTYLDTVKTGVVVERDKKKVLVIE